MTLQGPEAQGADLVRKWVVDSGYAGTVIVGDSDDIPAGDFVVIDLSEDGAEFTREGLGSWDGTVPINLTVILREVAGANDSERRLNALSETSVIRRGIMAEAATDGRLLSVGTINAAIKMAQTDALPGSWAAAFALTLYAQP